MAISHSVEDAIVEGGGTVNARQLANDLQTRGRYFSGDLDLIAKFANIARPVMVTPGTVGTPGANAMFGPTVGGGLGAIIGGLVGGPQGAILGTGLGAAGGAAGPALSFAGRQYLQSQMGQSRAIPSYNANAPAAPGLRNALIGLPVAQNQLSK